MSSPTLILAGAFAGELAPFASFEGILVDLGDGPMQISLRETGVGNVAAALSVMSWHADASSGQSIGEILFIGSCGLYQRPPNMPLPGMAFGRTFCSYELASLDIPPRAKSLPSVSGTIRTEPGRAGQMLVPSAMEVAVNAPDAVSLVSVDPTRLPSLCDVSLPFAENLEVFGMAKAALKCGLKFSALMAVTNEVNADGSSAWLTNYAEGASLVAALVNRVLFSKK